MVHDVRQFGAPLAARRLRARLRALGRVGWFLPKLCGVPMDLRGRSLLLGLRYGIGDVVMELPVLHALRRAAPDARITAVGAHPAVELLDDRSVVDDVVAMEAWGLTHRWDPGDESVRASLRQWLENRQFDVFLDTRQLPPVFGEIVRSLGRPMLDAADDAERAAVCAGANAVEAIQAAVRAGWGEQFATQSPPGLICSAGERSAADHFLHEHGLAGRRLVGICPIASLELKRWPLERFVSVVNRILARTGYGVLFFCGPHEALSAEVLARVRHDGRVACVGGLHLRQVAGLVERCAAFLCNDTGLAHIAAALGVPTVVIFGITDPRVYQPPGAHTRSVGGKLACPYRNTGSLEPPSCFFNGHCLIADQGCIDSVHEAEVMAALATMLEQSGNGSIERRANGHEAPPRARQDRRLLPLLEDYDRGEQQAAF